MSLKDNVGRKLTSPLSIKIPSQYTEDYDSLVMFEEIKLRMWELYDITNANNQINEISEDYTTSGSEILLPSNTLTITLNETPINQERVTIKNIGGVVTINGNGRNIDGSQTLIVDKLYDAPTITYIESKDQWYII